MAYEAFGERRLMLAVLEDAIRTLLLAKRTGIPRKRLVSELAWLQSRSHTEPFAFESICDVLGIDASYLRGRLVSGACGAYQPGVLKRRASCATCSTASGRLTRRAPT